MTTGVTCKWNIPCCCYHGNALHRKAQGIQIVWCEVCVTEKTRDAPRSHKCQVVFHRHTDTASPSSWINRSFYFFQVSAPSSGKWVYSMCSDKCQSKKPLCCCWALLRCPGFRPSSLICPCLSCRAYKAWAGIWGICAQIKPVSANQTPHDQNSVVFSPVISICQFVGPVG